MGRPNKFELLLGHLGGGALALHPTVNYSMANCGCGRYVEIKP